MHDRLAPSTLSIDDLDEDLILSDAVSVPDIHVHATPKLRTISSVLSCHGRAL